MKRTVAACGTITGRARHIRLGEPLCEPCHQGYCDHRRATYQVRKSGHRISVAEALAELGLPPDRIPAGSQS